ncbi:MAG TPA: MjaI family restriction endonuclease [Caldithrix abyssi]|uniref:MjaI family restriction endonuclease n=1 Tax=Caldithrix abyssi TaxID=187145 RepID=A0A7V4WVC3_CALAY|nr:MjaI family restriction endonuclease [Caldithrix abyssi]
MKTRFKIPFDEVKELLGTEKFEFPKYSTQILNLANQNAQGTRPSVVGQMSELIQEFSGQSVAEWEKWYIKRHPDAIEKASQKIKEMIENFKSVIDLIDDEMITNWVKDLVIIKTFIGLKFQEAILSKIASRIKTTYKLATPDEESKGIDGFIGNQPVSIKPETYKSKMSLQEKIDVKFIFYNKTKNGIIVNIEGLL